MNIKYLLFLQASLVFNKGFSQKIKPPTISIGVTHRMASIRLNDKPITRNVYGFYYQVGWRENYLSIDINEKVFKEKFILELSNYFTYSEFRQIAPDPSIQRYFSEKRFKHDHFISLLYPFKSKEKRPKFILGAGIGYMNLGTSFRYDRFEGYDNNNNPIVLKNVKGAFSFLAPKLIIGLQKERLNGFFIINGTPDREKDPNPTLWIEFKGTYSFNFFQQKKK